MTRFFHELCRRSVVAIVASGALISVISPIVHAQTTYTWGATGISQNIGDGGNWVGGTPPSFVNNGTNSDSAIFSASNNTTVVLTNDALGDNFNTVTFDASAPSYNFQPFPGNTVNDMDTYGTGNGFFNNSGHTQDFSALPDIYAQGGTIAATTGDSATHLSYKIGQIYFNSTKITGDFDVTTATINSGGSATRTLTKSTGAGTLFITGDSGTNAGILVIGNSAATSTIGAVRISNSNALGAGGTTVNNYTQILGGTASDGRLELVNNITTNEGIRLAARQGNVALAPAILNVSDNNTMTGPFLMAGGGAVFNFGSTSGTLTVTSNIDWALSGDRYLVSRGAGNIVFSGNISNSGSAGGIDIQAFGPGTLTLSGAANANVSNWIIKGGTLALGANSTFSFDALSDDLRAPDGVTHLAPRVFMSSGGTLDVSAVVGGFNLTQTLQGSGDLVGSIHMASGTQIIPGGGANQTVNGDIDPTNSISYGVGQLHFHNGLDMSAGSQMVWHLGALSTSTPGTNFDQLTVDGALTLGGTSSLSVDLSLLGAGSQPGGGDPFWTTSHTWTIISNTNNPGSSNFASIAGGTVATGTFTTSVTAGALLGDVNGDHVVNGLDIAVVASHWLATGATLGQGDANGDGTVNGLDIALIASHWLSTGGGTGGSIILTYTPSAGGGTSVPEPSTVVLATLGLISLTRVRRQRRVEI